MALGTSTSKKYESLKEKRKLPHGRTMKLHIRMDSLLKIDAISGSLLADDSLDNVTLTTFYILSWLFNHALIHSTILVTYSSCSIPLLSNSTTICEGYDGRASSRTTCIILASIITYMDLVECGETKCFPKPLSPFMHVARSDNARKNPASEENDEDFRMV